MRWWFGRRRLRLDVDALFPARPKKVWAHLMNVVWLDGEAVWKPGQSFFLWDGTRIKVLEIEPPRRLRFHWIPPVGERSTVELQVGLHPSGRAQIRLHQEGLTSGEQRDRFRTRWEKSLESIRRTL